MVNECFCKGEKLLVAKLILMVMKEHPAPTSRKKICRNSFNFTAIKFLKLYTFTVVAQKERNLLRRNSRFKGEFDCRDF